MKTIDEKLFEQLNRLPHMMHKRIRAEIMQEHKDMPERRMPGPPPHRFPGPPPHGFPGPHGRPGPGGCGQPPFARESVLLVIQEFETGARQKEIAEKLRIGPSATSEMITKLEQDGYVRRTVDPEDKRATRILLTELGEARANEIHDERQARIQGIFAVLTTEEKEQLLTLLTKLNTRRIAE